MRKIIVKIRGGLGNQLFQYAFAKYLMRKSGAEKLIIDTSYFNKKHIRGLELNKLSVSNCEFKPKSNIVFDICYFIFRIFDRITHHKIHIFQRIVLNNMFYFCDKTIDHKKIYTNFTNAYLAGYFQQETIIRNVSDELKRVIIPKSSLSDAAKSYLKEIENNKSIAISIRAGEDYNQFGWPLCSPEYYRKGLDLLLKNHPGSKIFIFSDCISKVKKEKWFEELEVNYIEKCNSTEGLYLLSQCDNYVIANSTFSWLGSYLSKNLKRDIIAPKYFYRGSEMKSGGLHIPNCIYLDNQTGKLQ